MSSKKAQQLRQSILKYNTEMSKLKDELEYSQEANTRYNKILLKKAICKKQLDELKVTPLQSLAKFFRKFSSNKSEKLICDYFK